MLVRFSNMATLWASVFILWENCFTKFDISSLFVDGFGQFLFHIVFKSSSYPNQQTFLKNLQDLVVIL